ncbi:MAG: metalloregulator ArsR/SmtB family transcription factor [Candidatus Hadarchaeales archaeon]
MGTRELRVLKCLSDETRYRIFLLLGEGEKCVCELVRELRKEQPLISHHLRLMKKCGLVSSRNEGRRTYYRLSKSELSKLLEVLKRL